MCCPPRFTLFPYTTLFRSWGFRASRRSRAATARTSPPASKVFSKDSSDRSEEHTSELQSRRDLVCRLLLEKKKITYTRHSALLRISHRTRGECAAGGLFHL